MNIAGHLSFQILINLEGHGRQVGGIGCQRNIVPQLSAADRHCLLQRVDEGSAFQKRNIATFISFYQNSVIVHLNTWQLHNLSILVVFYGQVRVLDAVVLKLRRGVVEIGWIVDSQTLHCIVDVFVALFVILWQVREGANPVIFIRLFLCLCSVFSTVFGNGQRLLIPAVIRIKLHFPTALCCLVKGEVEVGSLAMLQGVLVVPFFVELDFLRPGELVGDGDFLLVVFLLLILLLVGVFLIGDLQVVQQGLEVIVKTWILCQKILQVAARIDIINLAILDVALCRPQLHHLVPRHAALVVVFGEVVEVEFLNQSLIFQQRLNRLFSRIFFFALNLNCFVSDFDLTGLIVYRVLDRGCVVLFFIKDQLDNRDNIRAF